MNEPQEKDKTAAEDAGGPPPDLTDVIDESVGAEDAHGDGDNGTSGDIAAADGGSVPPGLVAEIEDGIPGEFPDGGEPEDVEEAIDAGRCPEGLIAGIEEMYDDDDRDDAYDTDDDE